MPKMTGGQALAKSLYLEGVRVIFGLPGVQLYHMLDGLVSDFEKPPMAGLPCCRTARDCHCGFPRA